MYIDDDHHWGCIVHVFNLLNSYMYVGFAVSSLTSRQMKSMIDRLIEQRNISRMISFMLVTNLHGSVGWSLEWTPVGLA